MQLFIFDRNEQLQLVLENVGDALGFSEPQHKEDLLGLSTFSFNVPFSHPDAAKIKEGFLVGFMFDGSLQAFEIIEIYDNTIERTKEFEAEHIKRELLDDFIEDRPIINVLPAAALQRVLQGTRWTPGKVTIKNAAVIESIRAYRESVMAAVLDDLHTNWGGEFVFRLETNGQRITGRYVDWVEQRGEYTGKRFESDKDIDSFERIVQSADVKTAVYCYGRSEQLDDGVTKRTDIKNVVWNYPNNPTNKPAGVNYLADNVALGRFGRPDSNGGKRHRFGFYENGEVKDPKLLAALGWAYLQTVNKPYITYKMNVIHLAALTGYDHEKFRLGDTVNVLETNYSPALLLQSRIVSFERDLLDPRASKVVLETVQMDLAQALARLKRLEQLVEDRQGVWDGSDSGTSTIMEYKVDMITATVMEIDFTSEYKTEPAAFVTVYGSNTTITPEFIKGPAEGGEGFAYQSVKLTFDAALVGKRFSLMIMGE